MTRDNQASARDVRQENCDIQKVEELFNLYMSDYTLLKYRVEVGVYWLKFFLEYVDGSTILDSVATSKFQNVIAIYDNFNDSSYARIKEIMMETRESETKACALYIAEKLEECGLGCLKSYVYIGCTETDINSVCYAKMIGNVLKKVWVPTAEKLVENIIQTAKKCTGTSLLAMYTGKPSIPSTFSKELLYYAQRLQRPIERLKNLQPYAQFSGIGGNHINLSLAFPDEDWQSLSQIFVRYILNLECNVISAEEADLDYICIVFDDVRLFKNILKTFALYMWDTVNMYGNVGNGKNSHECFLNAATTSNHNCISLSEQLSLFSRQRSMSEIDLPEAMRLALLMSVKDVIQVNNGLSTISFDNTKLTKNLSNAWEVLVEVLKTVLQKYGYTYDLYELNDVCKSQETYREFVNSLDVLQETDKEMLLSLTPAKCALMADKVAERF